MLGSTQVFCVFPFHSRFHLRCKWYNGTSVKCCCCDSLLGMETKLASLLFVWIQTSELLQVKVGQFLFVMPLSLPFLFVPFHVN
jgi:hypothetical protein